MYESCCFICKVNMFLRDPNHIYMLQIIIDIEIFVLLIKLKKNNHQDSKHGDFTQAMNPNNKTLNRNKI